MRASEANIAMVDYDKKRLVHPTSTSTSGFTLIELLIVIVIISIVSSIALLSINVNQNKRLESMTNQLVNTFKLAEEEALLRSTTLSFILTNNAFQFYEYQTSADPKQTWHALNNTAFKLHHIPSNVQMTLKIQGEVITDTDPHLIISQSGDITPFTLYIGKKDSTPRYKIIGKANGVIKSEMIETDEEK